MKIIYVSFLSHPIHVYVEALKERMYCKVILTNLFVIPCFVGTRQIYKISHVTSRMIMYNNKTCNLLRNNNNNSTFTQTTIGLNNTIAFATV